MPKNMVSETRFFKRFMPYAAVILLQFGYAGMNILAKFALNKGMSHYTFVVYRHAIATLVLAPFALFFERRRPKMTWSIFFSILLMGLLEPVIDQNFYYEGMKRTSASFTAAMCNILPAFTFVLAWVFRLERVNLKQLRSLAKIIGTGLTVGGAMVMTFVKGSTVISAGNHHDDFARQITSSDVVTNPNPTVGALMIGFGCISWAVFIMAQAKTLQSYPAELSLAAMICIAGMVEGAAVALVAERGNPAAWAIHLDCKLFAVLYSGVICSGMAYYLQGVIMKHKGPVFVTTFNPLGMIICTIAGCMFLGEKVHVGGLIGAMVIVCGLYSVIWGRRGDQSSSRSGNDQPEVSMHTINSNKVSVDGSNHASTRVAPTSECDAV